MKTLTKSALLGAFLTTITACGAFGLIGNRNIISKTQVIDQKFEALSIENGYQFSYQVSDPEADYQVMIKTSSNLMAAVSVEVDAMNTLVIKDQDFISFSSLKELIISGPAINKIELSGGSHGTLANWSTNTFKVKMSGGSKLDLSGTIESFTLNSSGGSSLSGESLHTKEAKVTMSGGAHSTLNISQILDAKLSGGSKLSYTGRPKIKQDLSGGSTLKAF